MKGMGGGAPGGRGQKAYAVAIRDQQMPMRSMQDASVNRANRDPTTTEDVEITGE